MLKCFNPSQNKGKFGGPVFFSPSGPVGLPWLSSLRRHKFSLKELRKKYERHEPLTMITAYDNSSARMVDKSGIDMILVGDSLGMVVLGDSSTKKVTLEQVIHHCSAVSNEERNAMIIGDLPFGSYLTPEQTAYSSTRLIKEGGVDAVKLEGGKRVTEHVRTCVKAGLAVFGHIGLTPQTCSITGGYTFQGRSALEALRLLEDAHALQEAGACVIVLEMMSAQLAQLITDRLNIPTVGIGAGPGTSGQVLVWHDVMGMYDKPPKFSKVYADCDEIMQQALRHYRNDVLSRRFPSVKHTMELPAHEWKELYQGLTRNSKGLVGCDRRTAPADPLVMDSQRSPASQDSSCSCHPRTSLKKIVIVGGGALGTYVAGKLAARGNEDNASSEIWILGRSPHSEFIRRKGVSLIEGGSSCQHIPVRVGRKVEEVLADGRRADVVIVAVKTRDIARAAREANELLSSDGMAIAMQNGLDGYEVLCEEVGTRRCMRGLTNLGISLGRKIGSVELRGNGMTYLLPSTPDAVALSKCLAEHLESSGIPTTMIKEKNEQDRAVWKKLLINSCINPLTALFGVNNGTLATTAFQPILKAVAEESHSVVTAAFLRQQNGVNGGDRLFDGSPATIANSVAAATAKNTSSMLADLLRGRKTEIEAINGRIVSTGKMLDIPTPLNSFLTKAVCCLEGLGNRHSDGCCTSMKVIRTVEEMQAFSRSLKARNRQDRSNNFDTVGLVPTMGALHDGHLKLVREARRICDAVVVSIFVNPLQFAPHEDFACYPAHASLESDLQLLKKEGVDAVFVPQRDVMYPGSPEASSFLDLPAIETTAEGRSRPGFFRGVATVVLKLFNSVQPSVAFFGQKDGMQSIVMHKMVRDLNLPIEVKIVNTVREPDGVAMSSRNVYLSPEERSVAPLIFRGLQAAQRLCQPGDSNSVKDCVSVEKVKRAVSEVLDTSELLKIQYVSVADARCGRELSDETLLMPGDSKVQDQGVMISVAAFLGKTRLIDNVLLSPVRFCEQISNK